ncbi:MAG: TetR/AcrR family transcriptional regulator [Gammaproteobacteria bacterium]
MATSKKDQLIQTALGLFYKYGYHATGIDQIIAESGVSKMTLYSHFKSKEELFLAALKQQQEKAIAWVIEESQRRGGTPRERLLAVLEAYLEVCEEEGFQGCRFVNATVEFPEHDHPIHQAAAEYKHKCTDYMCELATSAGARDPNALASGLMLLLDGAIVTVHVTGQTALARKAYHMAEIILAEALDRSAP